MRSTREVTDETVLRELGVRLAKLRLERNLTQASLAVQAGISKRTLERLESGEAATQLSGFLRVCRVLDLIERVDVFIPEPVPSLTEQLKRRGRRQYRASGPRKPVPASSPWMWEGTP